jgi:hypothetical protein
VKDIGKILYGRGENMSNNLVNMKQLFLSMQQEMLVKLNGIRTHVPHPGMKGSVKRTIGSSGCEHIYPIVIV